MHAFLHSLLNLSSCARSKKKQRRRVIRTRRSEIGSCSARALWLRHPGRLELRYSVLRSCILSRPGSCFLVRLALPRLPNVLFCSYHSRVFLQAYCFSGILCKIPEHKRTKSRMDKSKMDKTLNCTKSRMNKIRNWWTKPRTEQNSKQTKSRIGQSPEWTKFRMARIPNWAKSRMNKIFNTKFWNMQSLKKKLLFPKLLWLYYYCYYRYC